MHKAIKVFALFALGAVLSLPGLLSTTASGASDVVPIRVLSLASWLGQMEPLPGAGGQTVGGAATLAAYWQRERDPNTISLATGNSFGASPPLSNLFNDLPAMYALNMLGVQADTLGNDNFDHGLPYLQNLVGLAQFDYVAANMDRLQDNLRGVKPYSLIEVDGVKVAIIGAIDTASPGRVFPGNFGSIAVTDPGAAAASARQQAAAAGAKVFILITEMQMSANPVAGSPSGPLLTLARQVQGFDLVLGASDAGDYSTTINGALVVANQRRGATYVRTSLTYTASSGRVTDKSAVFVTPWTSQVTPDPKVAALVASTRAELSGRLSEVLATSPAEISLTDACGAPDARSCESLAANLIADALRGTYRTDFAIVNAGAVRAAITCPTVNVDTDFCPPVQAPSFPVTRGQIEAALPFTNSASVANITGAELKAFLENSVSLLPASAGRFAQVSGLCYAYDIGRPAGSRVTAVVRQGDDGACSPAAVELSASASYTIAINNFMAAGGDGYPVLQATPDERAPLVTVVSDYLTTLPALNQTLQGRISCSSSGSTPCPAVIAGPTGQVRVSASADSNPGAITPPRTGDAGLR